MNCLQRSTTGPARPAPRILTVLALAAACALPGCFMQDQSRSRNQRELGLEAFRNGDYGEARYRFNQALEAKPDDFRQNYWLGRVELAQGNPLAAQRQFEYAWTVRGDDPQWTPKILDGIAESLYQQDRYDALHSFLAETTDRYGTTDSYLREAAYLVKTGDPDAAQVAYRKAARLSGQDDPAVYIAVAEFYESVNNVPEAVKSLRYAYYLDPENEQVAEKFRQFGLVPGPTLKLEPPRPQMLD